jgi:hypothetical protein
MGGCLGGVLVGFLVVDEKAHSSAYRDEEGIVSDDIGNGTVEARAVMNIIPSAAGRSEDCHKTGPAAMATPSAS